MRCKRCGTESPDNRTVCARCGAPLRDRHKPIAVILIIIGAVIGAMFLYLFVREIGDRGNSGYNGGGGGGGGGGSTAASTATPAAATHTPTPMPTPTPTARPTPTPAPQPTPTPTVRPTQTAAPRSTQVVETVRGNPYYSVYENIEYGLSCPYPIDFKVYSDPEVLFAVRTEHGTAKERIDIRSAAGTTLSAELEGYIRRCGGTVDYRHLDDDHYAVSIIVNETAYYKYCKFKNDRMYSFEFICPTFQNDAYSRYIEDIYAGFTVTG